MKIGSFLVPPNTIKYTSLKKKECRRGCDHMVVGVTTTCAISAYHYLSCEFEPRSWRDVLDTTLCDKVCQ